MTCDLCFADEQLTERTTRQAETEHLCGDCYRWSDYWDSLNPRQQDDTYRVAP